MDRANLNSSRFLTLSAVVAAGFLCGCVPDYTTSYDPRVDGLSPMQTASAEPGILDDQKNLPHTNAVMPTSAKPAAPAPSGTAAPSAEGATPPAAPSTTPPPPPSGDQPAPPPPVSAPATPPPPAG